MTATGSASGRIVGFDFWRTLLMTGGIFVHASLWLEPRPLFQAIEQVSHTFRMGAFFALSAYLSALLLGRRSRGPWLSNRLLTLGVPTVVAMATVGPFVHSVVRHASPAGAVPMWFDWHHLWFLFALIAYAPVAALLDRFDRDGKLFGAELRRAMFLVAGATAILITLGNSLLVTAASPAFLSSYRKVALIPGYLPIFCFGHALARNAQLRAAAQRDRRAPALVLAAVAATYMLWFGWLAAIAPAEQADGLASAVLLLGASATPAAAVALMVRSALAMERVSPVVVRLCDASFTLYLLHLPIIVAFNLLVAPALPNPYIQYVAAVAVSGVLSVVIHERLVRHSPLLRFLLNGRLPPTARAAPATG